MKKTPTKTTNTNKKIFLTFVNEHTPLKKRIMRRN